MLPVCYLIHHLALAQQVCGSALLEFLVITSDGLVASRMPLLHTMEDLFQASDQWINCCLQHFSHAVPISLLKKWLGDEEAKR